MAKSDDKNVIEMPDGPPDATGLTPREQRVLATIKDSIETGLPALMREIGTAVGLTSSSSVAHQLRVLEGKGFLKRDPNRPRALEVFLPEVMAARRSMSSGDESSVDETGIGESSRPRSTSRSSAGSPPAARSSPRSRSPTLPAAQQLVGEGTLFLLEVSGDSMVDAAICNGDYVVIRQEQTASNGQILTAIIDGEATVKTFSARSAT